MSEIPSLSEVEKYSSPLESTLLLCALCGNESVCEPSTGTILDQSQNYNRKMSYLMHENSYLVIVKIVWRPVAQIMFSQTKTSTYSGHFWGSGLQIMISMGRQNEVNKFQRDMNMELRYTCELLRSP
jgi:hypothetical protein